MVVVVVASLDVVVVVDGVDDVEEVVTTTDDVELGSEVLAITY